MTEQLHVTFTFSYLVYIPRNEMAGFYGYSMFNFFRNSWIILDVTEHLVCILACCWLNVLCPLKIHMLKS